MVKLSASQQAVIDALKAGGKLAVMFYIRGDSKWKLAKNASDWPSGETVSGNTIKALKKKGLIVEKAKYSVYPYEIWVVLKDAQS